MDDKFVVVFDTNVFLQALANTSGAAVRCLEYFEQGKIIIAISHATFDEVVEVLSRSHLRQKYPLLTDERIAALHERLVYHGIYLRRVSQHFSYPRDPDDEPFIWSAAITICSI